MLTNICCSVSLLKIQGIILYLMLFFFLFLSLKCVLATKNCRCFGISDLSNISPYTLLESVSLLQAPFENFSHVTWKTVLMAAVAIVINKNRIIHINPKRNTFFILEFDMKSRKQRVEGCNRRSISLELMYFMSWMNGMATLWTGKMCRTVTTLVVAGLSGDIVFLSQNLLCLLWWESSMEFPFDVPCKEVSLMVASRDSPARAAVAQKDTSLVLMCHW